jgi:hypothetical protein
MRSRTYYLPIEDTTEGMLLAEAVRDRYLTPLLPSGTTLSAENIQQLRAHRVDFICVSCVDARSAEEIAEEAAASAHRALEIFGTADMSDPVIAALFNQIFIYRSA